MRKHYGTADLANMFSSGCATLTGHKQDVIDAHIALLTARLTIIANTIKQKAISVGNWAVTILALIGLAPAAAIWGIVTISRDILQQRHGLYPEPLQDDAKNVDATNWDVELVPVAIHQPEQPTAPLPATDAPAQELPAVALPVPLPATERQEAAEQPTKRRKAKKKATERTDGPSRELPAPATRYRKKGNAYVEAKRRNKNEVLYVKDGDNYIPLTETLPVDLPAVTESAVA